MNKQISAYKPFARKYRPKNFNELLGQEVLVKTLSYCISSNRLAQAYLLTGIRGVGKTSSARIIAKTINCTDHKIVKNYIEPCEQCKNCQSFNKNAHPDIIEVDAASRTSVDDIRNIIESSEYKPLFGSMKFFIIDEIHMLSKNAFNALLKVIEEPPEHIIFIFATTEVQKIPLTVISRCQRYDLRRLTFEEIVYLVKTIAKKENISFEEEAINIIATKSEGSARDATSIMDQAASYQNNSETNLITAKLVTGMLGLIQNNIVLKLIKLIIANDPTAALQLVKQIYLDTHSLENVLSSISDFLAELSKYKLLANYSNLLYENYKTEITDILIGTSLSRLTTLWQIFSNGIPEIKQSHNELTCIEMLVIKAIYVCNLPTLEEITEIEKDDVKDTPSHIEINQKSKPTQGLHNIINNGHESENTTLEHISIFDFLKFCHKNKEMEIYYLLLNESEVHVFIPGILDISGNINNDQKSKLAELLASWSPIKWQIKTNKSNSINSLKASMLKKVKETGDWQIIKNNFPDANISDIILKS